MKKFECYTKEEFTGMCRICLDFDEINPAYLMANDKYKAIGYCNGENGIEGLLLRGPYYRDSINFNDADKKLLKEFGCTNENLSIWVESYFVLKKTEV